MWLKMWFVTPRQTLLLYVLHELGYSLWYYRSFHVGVNEVMDAILVDGLRGMVEWFFKFGNTEVMVL